MLIKNSIIFTLVILLLLIICNKIISVNLLMGWFIVISLSFWFLSTFFFFLKYYRYTKFTSSIRRFWKRSFNIFWLVESCWFIIFIYCLLTANHEPVLYEELYIYKNLYINSYKIFLLNNIIIILPILLLFFTIIFIKFISFYQFIIYFIFLNFFILFFFFIELYQFFNIISFFFELSWIFNSLFNLFEIVVDYWHFRPRVAFFSLMLIGKFWHCIFIISAWVIFLIKTIENNIFSVELISMNMQNLIIFYFMAWIQLISLIKWYLKFLFKKLWFWFFLKPLKIFLLSIFNIFDIFLLNYLKKKLNFKYLSFINFNFNFSFYNFIFLTPFNKVNGVFSFLFFNFLICNKILFIYIFVILSRLFFYFFIFLFTAHIFKKKNYYNKNILWK